MLPAQVRFGIYLTGLAGNKNNATIEATAGSLLLIDRGFLDQSGGGSISAIGASSIVQLGGAGTTTISGGPLNTSSGGVMRGVSAILAGNISTPNTFEVPANGSTYVTAPTWTNNGTVTLTASTSLLRFDANNPTITGSGAIVLTNGAILETFGGQAITNASGHTLKGNGLIFLDAGTSLTNNGTIAPGTSAGQLNVNSGNLILGSTSNLSFEIGGTTPATQYDVLNKGGSLVLNGTLTVRLINSFTPAVSDTFTIVTTQATLSGAFSNVASGQRLNNADGTGSFIVTYSDNNVVLSSFQPPVQPTPTSTPTATPISPKNQTDSYAIAAPQHRHPFARANGGERADWRLHHHRIGPKERDH